jgi:YfiH family protein
MWTLDADSPLPLWRTPHDEAVLAFTTRRGGVSVAPFDTLNLGRSTADPPEAVTENRRRVLETLATDPHRLATAGQVHGTGHAHVVAPGLHPNVDILVTTVPGIPLAVTSADCLPILLVAPGVIAAAHSGWRGTAAGAPRRALDLVCETAGIAPDRVSAHLGPCIRPCCYIVGPEVAAQFPEDAVVRAPDSIRLDLAHASRRQLLEAGMAESSIHDTHACTACEWAWYFSHRRDGPITGRHWGIAALRDESIPRRTNGSGV